jgi:2-keto-4-pentenoate hydratase
MARQLADRARVLEAGAAQHRGWKVAFTTPQSQAAAGVDRPVIGWLSSATELPDGATLDVAGWHRPTAEAELALHVGDDGGIAAVGAAIEIVDLDRPLDQVEEVIAGSIFHRAYVLGAADPERRGGRVDGVRIRALLDGSEVAAEADPCSVIGELPDVLAGVSAELDRHGLSLAPGDVILAGSAIPLQPVEAGQRLRVEAEGLGALELTLAAGA